MRQVSFIDSLLKPRNCSVTFRSWTGGREAALIDLFLNRTTLVPRRENKILVLREPCIEHAYPDLLVVEWSPRKMRAYSPILSIPKHARALAIALLCGSMHYSDIVDTYGSEAIARLLKMKLIYRLRGRSEFYAIRSALKYPIIKMVVIEAKVNHVANAAQQASQALRYAQAAFVLTETKQAPEGYTLRQVNVFGQVVSVIKAKDVLSKQMHKSLRPSILHWEILGLIHTLDVENL